MAAAAASRFDHPRHTFFCDLKFTDVRLSMMKRKWKLQRTRLKKDEEKKKSFFPTEGLGFLWTNYRHIDFLSISKGTYVNHLEGVTALSVKSNLWDHVKDKEGVRVPYTRVVRDLSIDWPLVAKDYEEHCASSSSGRSTWIVKPMGLSCGRGIEIVETLDALKMALTPSGVAEGSGYKPMVVQKYIPDPCLLGGKKFDFRVYVSIVSLEPSLEVYMFKRPYARLSSVDFTMDDISNKFIHLTNFSIQSMKSSEAQLNLKTDENLSPPHPTVMWSTEDCVKHFGEAVWESVIMPQFREMSRKTIEAVVEKGCLTNYGRGFEMFGFDFMLNEQMEVFLIEVNLDPDQSHSTKVTSKILPEAIEGLINIVLGDERGGNSAWERL